MIKKLVVLGVCALALTAIISCEKDFNDIGTSVVSNTKFNTGQIELEVEIEPVNIDSVRTDNLQIGNLGEYWLGVYNNSNAERLEASIISQVGLATNRKFVDKEYASTDVVLPPVLDGVILKIPLTATLDGKHENNKSPKFKVDNLLGDKSKNITLKVFQSETFLNNNNDIDPTKPNAYYSNKLYSNGLELGSDNNFSYDLDSNNETKDTVYYFDRTVLGTTVTKYKDSVKIANGSTIKANPFKYIELDKNFFQTNFIDKYETGDFATQDAFIEKVLKAVIIVAEGSDGAAVPLNFSNSVLKPSIDLLLTTTVKDESGKVIDSIGKVHNYPFTGISNSIYKMTTAVNPVPSNNFVVQGTAGSMGKVKVLGVNLNKLKQSDPNNMFLKYEDKDVDQNGYIDLDEMSNIIDVDNGKFKLLINDASLTFNVNQTINNSSENVAQKLYLYQGKLKLNDNNEMVTVPTHLTDSYFEAATFGGDLVKSGDLPSSYTFRVTDYLSKLLSKEDDFTNDPLLLKVYNPTDAPVVNNLLDVNVKSYNWNPRAVTLYDGNSVNGTNKAVLKVYYSEKK